MRNILSQAGVHGLYARTGEELGVSGWLRIDQDMIDRFADLTRDHAFIHVDPERARETPFGGTIAHGFLVMSLLPVFEQEIVDLFPANIAWGLNYGLDRLRFTAPVPSGSRVRGRFTLASVAETSPGQHRITLHVIVEREGEERPALVADWIILVAEQPA